MNELEQHLPNPSSPKIATPPVSGLDPKAAELTSLLASIEKTDGPLRELEVGAQVRALAGQLSSTGETPSDDVQAEALAFHFNENHPKGSGWGLYYGPMQSWADVDGNSFEDPSIAAVTPEILTYWATRAEEATHPTLRGRYADLSWEFGNMVKGARRDPDMARICIDAAIDLASRTETTAMTGRTKLTRALQLALLLRDRTRVNQVRDAMITFMQATAEDAKAGTWVYCFDQLVSSKVRLDSDQESLIISDLESRLGHLAGSADQPGKDPWGAQNAAKRLATYYRKKDQQADVRRVLLKSGAAFERLSKDAAPLAGASWMKEVWELYREFGLISEAEALDPLLAELNEGVIENLKEVSHSIKIPGEVFDNLAKEVVASDLKTSLGRIVAHFLVHPDRARQDVLEIAKAAPVQALLSQVHVDDRGRPECEIGSTEDDLEGRVLVQMAQTMNIDAIFLRHAIQAVHSHFSPSADELLGVLADSPVFEESQHDLLRRAMEAYLQEDWAVFAHLIVPQIEQAVRTLVLLTGGSHLSSHQGGGTKLRPLGALLSDPGVDAVFGSPTISYMRVVLTEVRGLNFRNAISHGYLIADRFEQAMSDRLLHVALLLSQVRTSPSLPKSSEDSDPSK